MKIIQREDLAVLRRKVLYGRVNCRTLVAFFEAAIDGARIGRLANFVEGQGDRRYAAQLRTVEVGRQREQLAWMLPQRFAGGAGGSVGLIPLFIGMAMLAYAFWFAPKPGA